jgi:hypothetical protein
MAILQVTLTAGVATQISPHGIGFRQLILQNNGAAAITVGTRNSLPTSTVGTQVAAGGNANYGPANIQLGVLSDYYGYCATSQLLNVDYVPA